MAERRYTLVFYAAVLTAILATYGVYRYLLQAKQSSQVPMQSVVIAARDMAEGEKLERLSVSLAQWPASTAPDSAFTSIDSAVGRVARVAVFKGEPIVPGRLPVRAPASKSRSRQGNGPWRSRSTTSRDSAA